MNKPGVMIYFDMRPSKKFSPEERAMLYDAMLDFAQAGVMPEFEGALAIVWESFAPWQYGNEICPAVTAPNLPPSIPLRALRFVPQSPKKPLRN